MANLLKFVVKWTLVLLSALVATAVGLIIFKDSLLRPLVEKEIRSKTGMVARIEKFETSILSPLVHVENMRLYNTEAFGGSTFLNISELHLEYDLDALQGGKLGFKLVRLRLEELNIVRNESGKLNLDTKSPVQTASPPSGANKTQNIRDQHGFVGIETLNLSLGKFRYTDMKTPANNREMNLGIQDVVFKKIRKESELYGMLMVLLLKHGINF